MTSTALSNVVLLMVSVAEYLLLAAVGSLPSVVYLMSASSLLPVMETFRVPLSYKP
jgi:hypothetical protein